MGTHAGAASGQAEPSRDRQPPSSLTATWGALIGNVLVAITKAIAAATTGSSAMLSEAVHSVVDCGNEVLLLYGMRRARRPPDQAHPLGHGRELYFWSFVVALLIFAAGAGVSTWQGVRHILNPAPIEHALVSFVVLGCAALFEGASWIVSFRHFRSVRRGSGWLDAIRRSKDPPGFIVLLEDTAALAGLAVAALGIALALEFGTPWFDGAASIGVGLILGAVALLLARESKSLLIGERADPVLVDRIVAVAEAQPGVVCVHGALTMQLAPDQVAVGLSVDFDDTLRAPDIESAVEGIEARLRAERPEVVGVFLKPQKASAYRQAYRRRFGRDPA